MISDIAFAFISGMCGLIVFGLGLVVGRFIFPYLLTENIKKEDE